MVERLEERVVLSAVVQTDLLDYAPGSTAIITAFNDSNPGTDFEPGEIINFFIDRTDGGSVEAPPAIQTWNVMDGFGDFEPWQDDSGMWWFPDTDPAEGVVGTTWYVDPQFAGASLVLTATGQASGAVAQTEFTDARVIDAVTLDGASSVTVAPGAAISAALTVTTDGTGSANRWRSTGWRIATTAPGSVTVDNHTDYDSAGTHNQTISITAPSTPGTYTAYFIAYANDTGTGGGASPSATYTMTDAVVVKGNTTTTVSLATGTNPSTYGNSLTFTATVAAVVGAHGTPTGSVQFYAGATPIGSPVALSSGSATSPSISTLSATTHSITAVYSGSGTFFGSTSSAYSQVVNPKEASVTPSAASKTYGDADPAFSGTLAGFLVADGVTATYTRTAGETVLGGPYTISATLAPAGVLSNYAITYNTAAFTINTKAASVTPDAASKTYGDADPAFSGTLAGFLVADGVTATYTRTAGETVLGGPYTISATLAPAGVLSNYAITYNTAAFTINTKAASVTPDAASKTYGDADPAFSGTLAGFLVADGVTATYTRTAGETVLGGPYTISATLAPAGVLSNYAITYNTAAFTINTKAASVTPDAASKTYGDADPAFSGTLAGFLVADGVTATYTRTAGETVLGGPYTISATLAPAGVLSNYAITYNTAAFTINTKAASVTPDAASKTYGDADPAFSGTLAGFLVADGVTATYTRTAGETVLGGPYTISATLAPAGVLSNYAITYNTAAFTINTKAASVTPDAASKTYGDADPAFSGTLAGFLVADGVTATYTRTAGETVLGGPYTISATLAPAGVLSNYAITYNTAAFTINTKAASVTPDAASKTYGDADPAFSGTLAGFLVADGVTATYTRTAGETVLGGPYTISATLAPAGVLSNYAITYNTAAFTINTKAASVTPDAASKTYGDADPAFSGTLAGFLVADGVTATYTRTAGETVLGGPYTISATLAPAGVLSNYAITYNTAAFTINTKAASVTPDAASKTYGDADPAFSGTLAGFLVADGVTATYTRTAGETVLGGPYTISATLAPAGVLSNYAITYNTAAFTINTKAASVTPDAASKTYGDADPAFSGTLAGFLVADGVTATYTRTAGETVLGGPYTISATLAPAGVLSNYAITYNTAAFTINTKAASVTPDAASKTYGDADPAFSGTLAGFLVADGVTATYTRTAGETVLGGPYTISATLAPAGVLSNYAITYNTAAFTINTKAASVTPDAASKTYGDADPAFSGTLAGFLVADGVTATYTRTAGETVLGGPYTISATLAPAGVLSNYAITYNTAAFTINTKAASVTPDAASKTYGDADPAFSGTLAGFLVADGVTATYTRTAGETVLGGPYTISATLAPAGVLSNYAITYNTAAFTINTKAASVTPDAASKTYGDADPAFSGTLAGFLVADGVTATYTRTAGETVLGGPYTISATLAPAGVLSNYAITYNTAAFTINTKAASVTPDAASKTYGDADPAFSGTLAGFLVADGVTATYTRTAGETVLGGPYTISATLAPAGVLSNYAITYNTAAFTINTKAASVTPDAASKTYGDADPAFSGTLAGFLVADGVTATYTRTAGETVLGGPYTISATLAPAGVLSNYAITYNTAAFTINTRAITVTANNKSKIYGTTDPALTFSVGGMGLASWDTNATVFSGGLVRAAGETVAGSPYAITQGTLAANGNYSLTSFTPGTFTITARPITVTAENKTKAFGASDPALTFTVGGMGLAFSETQADVFTGSLTRAPGETVAGSPYAITQGTLAANSNYDITTFTPGTLTITALSATATLTVSPASVQYSDQSTFTVTITPGVVGGDQAATGVQFKINGSNVGGVVTLVDMGSYLEASLTTQILQNVGSHTVSAVLTGTSSNFSISGPANATLTVTREDARAHYTGPLFVTTASASSTSASVVLSATIRDITAETGDPAYDAHAGDIRTATVMFYIQETGQKIVVPVGLANPGDTKTGVVSTTVTLAAGSTTAGTTYTIYVYVGKNASWAPSGNYSQCPPVSTTVTVAIPTAGSISGGGYIVNTASAGTYAGDVGQKSNFGLNVKFNRNGRNIQGSMNFIIRRGDQLYQIKSTATNSMTIATPAPGVQTATFTSKANLNNVTDPLNPIYLGGNLSLVVTVTDRGEPGSADTIAVTLYAADGGLLHSSRWDGIRTLEQLLGGGNIQVRPAQLVDGAVGVGAPAGTTIGTDDVKGLMPVAIAQWQAAGADPALLARLQHVTVQVDNFPDDGLAWAMPGVITIDSDAAGHGWHVSAQPGGAVPAGRVDLLTVLTHELGHLIGRDSRFGDSNDIMEVALPVGVRRSPGAAETTSTTATPKAPSQPMPTPSNLLALAFAAASRRKRAPRLGDSPERSARGRAANPQGLAFLNRAGLRTSLLSEVVPDEIARSAVQKSRAAARGR